MSIVARHIVLAALLVVGLPLFAQVSIEMEGDRFTIGEPIPVTIEVELPSGRSVIWPDLNKIETGLEVVSDETDSTANNLSRQVQFMRFDTGTFFFPPLPIQFVSAGDTQVFETAASPYRISAFPADTTQDIRPIRDIQEVSFRKQPLALFGFLALCLFSLILWLIYRKLSQKPMTELPQVSRPKPVKPIEEHALERLKVLEEKKLWQSERIKEYYIELTDILREYVEYRYSLPALESTTAGLDIAIRQADVPQDEQDRLLAILRAADLVKFAKARPLPDQHRAAMTGAVEFINRTKPVRVAEEPTSEA